MRHNYNKIRTSIHHLARTVAERWAIVLSTREVENPLDTLPRVKTIFGNSFQPIEDSRRVTGQGLTQGIGLRMIPRGRDTYSFACQLLMPSRSTCRGDTVYFRN